ncbi:MAG: hypothetical protein ACUVQP_06145, partial [Bacteroidales bacterium]
MKIFCYSLFIFISLSVFAQKNIDTCIAFPMFSANYMLQFPGADIAHRFGVNSNIGGSFMIKNKKNILLELNGNYIF